MSADSARNKRAPSQSQSMRWTEGVHYPRTGHRFGRLLRRFIGFAIAVFALYCWASVEYQNQVDVPDYRMVTVDVLGGKTRQQWDADKGDQFQRLIALENKRYQLPAGATLKLTMPDGTAKTLSDDVPLTSEDFSALIGASTVDGKVALELRDPTAIYNLETSVIFSAILFIRKAISRMRRWSISAFLWTSG